MYNLESTIIIQLPKQDMNISKIFDKCKSMKNDKPPYYLEEYGITYRKNRDWPNIFHTFMVPNTLQPFILYKSNNALGHNGSSRLYSFIRRHYYWKK